MSLMSALYVGNSGLKSGQNSLNTTAHNMANADTIGYVRQQAYQATNTYNTLSVDFTGVASKQYGTGVVFAQTRQVRDYFLDLTYRKESGRSAFYDTSYSAMNEVEVILGELNQVAFQESLKDLNSAVQELAKEPSGAVQQGLFIQSCNAFLTRAQSVYDGLSNYQDNTNENIKLTVDKINEYGKQIKVLNDQIRYIETAGVEHANDLRDVRNQLVDELSAMGKIEVQESYDGTLTIKFEDEVFVQADTYFEIGLSEDATTGFYTPFWPQNTPYELNESGMRIYDPSRGGKVFNLDEVISADSNTDIGELKSMLLARGEKRGNYTDLNDKEMYNTTIAQSIIVNIQAEFDRLVNGVTEAINKVIKEETGYEVFKRVSGTTKDPVDGTTPGIPVETDTLYTTQNLIMNSDLVEQPTLLEFSSVQEGENYEALEKLKDIFEAEEYSLNPNVLNKTSFMKYYDALIGQISNSGSVYKNISSHQQDVVLATETQRQSIIGVSTEEELSNMVKFQNGYNASSRYINAISEMLEHIIVKLG